jgi:predicted  nucleic acid-binding Zn-ribbon protein
MHACPFIKYVQNNAVIETRKTLEGAKIQLAAQTEENAQLRTRLEETGKEVTEFQKECNHLRLMQRMATESKARLSADAKHQINLLKGQVTAAKNEATAAESQAQKAQQLAEQYLNELQDSAAVLAEEQRKGVVASGDHQSQLAKAQEKYRAQLAHLEQQVMRTLSSCYHVTVLRLPVTLLLS